MADALPRGDLSVLGPLLLASHASLRDDYGVSTPELDVLVELLVAHGAAGARLTGAGFGGCVVALVQRNHADDVAVKASRGVPRRNRPRCRTRSWCTPSTARASCPTPRRRDEFGASRSQAFLGGGAIRVTLSR